VEPCSLTLTRRSLVSLSRSAFRRFPTRTCGCTCLPRPSASTSPRRLFGVEISGRAPRRVPPPLRSHLPPHAVWRPGLGASLSSPSARPGPDPTARRPPGSLGCRTSSFEPRLRPSPGPVLQAELRPRRAAALAQGLHRLAAAGLRVVRSGPRQPRRHAEFNGERLADDVFDCSTARALTRARLVPVPVSRIGVRRGVRTIGSLALRGPSSLIR